MDDRKMEIIKQLMDELQEEMSYGKDDLAGRLGRPEPKVEVMSLESKEDPEMGLELGDDEEGMGDMEDCSPEDKLKSRLMKMRG